MNIKKFFGKNSREALALVRHALGPDAVILANKSINGGNEILALGNDDMELITANATQRPVYQTSLQETATLSEPVSGPLTTMPWFSNPNRFADLTRAAEISRAVESGRFSEPVRTAEHARAAQPARHPESMHYAEHERFEDSRRFDEAGRYDETNHHDKPRRFAEPAAEQPHAQARMQAAESLSDFIARNRRDYHEDAPDFSYAEGQANPLDSLPSATHMPHDLSPMAEYSDLSAPVQTMLGMEEIMSEMREMRGSIETQLAELVWENMQRRDPTKSVILRTLLSAGFGAGLARHLTEKLPKNQTAEEAVKWVKSILESNLQTIPDESEILDKGGVFALIGPTGVGKTTTIAKLAARYVMKHGTQKLALITTDAYRIGGHEQLRIYGKILGVMVHAVKDEADLRIALEELKGKHTILIDTVGVNQRDEMVVQQIAMLSAEGTNVKRLLCLSATNAGETLTDVVSAYKGKGLAGCIITKLDEAATIGSTLDVIVREKLKIYYVANGQRVPEDLHIANSKVLVHHAFKPNKRSGGLFEFRDDELSLLMAHTTKVSNEQSLKEMHHG